jgi:WD40 repeat protein
MLALWFARALWFRRPHAQAVGPSHRHRSTHLARSYPRDQGHRLLPDGRRALSIGYDGTIKLWNVETGALLSSFEAIGHYLAYLPDERHVLYQDSEHSYLLDTRKGISINLGYRGRHLLSDNRHMLTFSGNIVDIYDSLTNSVTRIDKDDQSIRLMNGRRTKMDIGNRIIRLWDVENYDVVTSFTADADLTSKSCFGPLVVAGDDAGDLHILDLVEPLPSSPERV